MPCRYAGDNAPDPSERRIEESTFLGSALVIGGAGALETAVGRHGEPDELDLEGPLGVERGDRQYAWTAPPASASASTTAEGCPAHDGDTESVEAPTYHLIYRLDYDGVPDDEDRRTVETALRGLEEQLGWHPDGVVFSLGYSRSYFERVAGSVPDPLAVEDAVESDPAVAADGAGVATAGSDVCLHLASNDARKLLAAEAALWGQGNALGVDLPETFEGVFARPMNPPGRRAAVADGRYGTGEDDAAVAGEAWYADGSVQRVVTYDPDVEEADADEESVEGCPAHGDSADEETADDHEGDGHDADDYDGDHGGDGYDGDHGESADGCPAHDSGSDASDEYDSAESKSEPRTDGGSAGGCPAHGAGDDAETTADADADTDADEEMTGVRQALYGLNPGDSAPIEVDLTPGADVDAVEDARRDDTYYVPPVSQRAFPPVGE